MQVPAKQIVLKVLQLFIYFLHYYHIDYNGFFFFKEFPLKSHCETPSTPDSHNAEMIDDAEVSSSAIFSF